MKYRPDESTLISFMYGELDDAEHAKVEAYLSENPEELNKFRQMDAVRSILSNITDKEVIAPPLMQDDRSPVVPIWRTSYFRASISIAASFILILVAGKLLGPDISYANNELRISFGGKPAVQENISPAQGQLTSLQVREMIDASEKRVDEQLLSTQARLDKTLRQAIASSSPATDSLAREMARASEPQLKAFVTSLKEENLQMMRQYIELSTADQRVYMENLLVDFSKWQQEQRNQDLQLLFTRVNSIENNTNQLKEETEQILASIISSSEVREKQGN